jgi:hypothetical protein
MDQCDAGTLGTQDGIPLQASLPPAIYRALFVGDSSQQLKSPNGSNEGFAEAEAFVAGARNLIMEKENWAG